MTTTIKRRGYLATSLLGCLLVAILAGHPQIAAGAAKPQAEGGPQKQRRPNFTISKETTYVTEPINKDGYIDYVTALNRRLVEGVTPASNANVLLVRAYGPKPEGGAMPPEFYQWLSVEAPPERGDYFLSLFRYMKEHLKADPPNPDELYELQDRATQRPWTAKQYP
jgi:hypothetical protein